MKKQKILILITKSNWGGAQRYIYDLATNLPKDTFEVEVMAGGKGILIDKLIEANIKANGDLPIGRDISLIGDIKAFFKLIKIIKEKKPDILHVNSSKIGGLGALAGRLSGVKKIVFTAHGWAFNEDRGFASKLLIKFSYWIIILLSHITIAVSDAAKEQVLIWPFIKEKITSIHNGIKIEPIFSKINARYELLKLCPKFKDSFDKMDHKKTVIIGTIAELHHIKGYNFAIKGISELVKHTKENNPFLNVIYLIIGNGEEKEKLEKQIIDLEMQNNIFLLGHVDNASQYLKAFDIFILSSLSEGLAYVLLEAGSASLPIVATAVGGIPEVIDDMKSGILIQPRKPREIKHAIEFYLTHKKVRDEYAKAVHEKVVNEFSIEKMVDKTIEIYLN